MILLHGWCVERENNYITPPRIQCRGYRLLSAGGEETLAHRLHDVGVEFEPCALTILYHEVHGFHAVEDVAAHAVDEVKDSDEVFCINRPFAVGRFYLFSYRGYHISPVTIERSHPVVVGAYPIYQAVKCFGPVGTLWKEAVDEYLVTLLTHWRLEKMLDEYLYALSLTGRMSAMCVVIANKPSAFFPIHVVE